MIRHEWEMLNEDKISKHSAFVDFEFIFEVKACSDNRNGIYKLKVYNLDSQNNDKPTENIISIEDVTIIEFIGDTEKECVVISNELIHQYIGSTKGKGGRLYWYFYLKENADHNMLTENIWLSDIQIEKIKNQFEKFGLEKNKNLLHRKNGGRLCY